jgi:alpha-tubulin suppressor-like RCC1 family protein
MPYQPTLNFKTSTGTDLGSLGWITKEYLLSVYPKIANQLITPELWLWGQNSGMQLANNGAATSVGTPITTFSGGANWKYINSGSAIKTDGTLWTWSGGPLGNNTSNVTSTPITTFAGGNNWVSLSNSIPGAAIKEDGTLWTWGTNSYGTSGTNDTTQKLTPVTTFAGGTNWKQVSCSSVHTGAIKTDGTLWVWGDNYNGQLGLNDRNARTTPVQLGTATNWKSIVCSGYSRTITASAAIKTDGTLWTWGLNNYGQLGDNTAISRSTPVTTFAGGNNWKQISMGISPRHMIGIKTDGTLWAWGSSQFGQLGINNGNSSLTPVTTFAGGTNWKQSACGSLGVYAIKTDGTLWTWGYDANNELGVGFITNIIFTPVTTFLGGTAWKQVAAGGQNGLGIRTSDNLNGI